MKTHHLDCSQTVLTRAIQLALLAMFAAPALVTAQNAPVQKTADENAAAQKAADQAAEENDEGDVKGLVCPANYFEVGALGVSRSAPKFGEYNGLHRSGGYGVGNFGLNGGDGYCQKGGNLRWQVFGKDLGTTSRSLGASAEAQGQWSVGIGFDQLRHYTTTGFQTPYSGSPGDNVFTLAPGFGVINTTATSTASGYNQVRLTAAQLAAMRNVNVYNQRNNASFNANYAFNTEWSAKFDYRRLDMSGGKLISASSDAANLTSSGGFNYGAERIAMLINPTKSSTDRFRLGLNWTGKSAYASLEYYASLYHDDYSGLSWSSPFVSGGTAAAPNPATGTAPSGAFPLSTMSTPPSNMLHQLNFTGGYAFSPATKLAGGLSFGINTQNASYDGTYTPGTAPGLPVNSLDGRVLTRHADARLTHRFTPALNLSVGFKYNERDNNTPVNNYRFLNLGGTSQNVTNAPMSNKRQQADAVLTYRIDNQQRLNFSYDYDRIDRWCNSAAANNAQGANAAYYTTASCAQVPRSAENSLSANYRLAILSSLNFTAGYTHADRKATVNPSFYNPIQGNSQGYENYGWLAFFQASRREDLVKAGVNWQLTHQFSLGLNGRYTKDDYYDSTLGVQSGKSSRVNLSADYTASERASYGAYLSWQNRSRDLLSASDRNLKADPVNLWANRLTDRDTAIGVYGKQKLLGEKLQITEDLSYSLSKSRYDTTLVQNIAAAVGNSGSSPDIKSELIQLRLTGTYAVDKHSAISAGWLYQHLKTNDYYYNAYQYGFAPTSLLPTNQQAPSYSVNTVYLVYRYTF